MVLNQKSFSFFGGKHSRLIPILTIYMFLIVISLLAGLKVGIHLFFVDGMGTGVAIIELFHER